MNFLEKQDDRLEKLAQNLHEDANRCYDRALYTFTYLGQFDTIEGYFEYQKGEDKFNTGSKFSWQNYAIAKNLRSTMKAHTGGEWKSFTLTIESEGKANVKFQYPEDQS